MTHVLAPMCTQFARALKQRHRPLPHAIIIPYGSGPSAVGKQASPEHLQLHDEPLCKQKQKDMDSELQQLSSPSTPQHHHCQALDDLHNIFSQQRVPKFFLGSVPTYALSSLLPFLPPLGPPFLPPRCFASMGMSA